jgi:hypothetical protein
MAKSEVKRLLEEITLHYEAATRALTSPSIMAPHEFIQKRMEEIEIIRNKITGILGDEFAATEAVVKQISMIDE